MQCLVRKAYRKKALETHPDRLPPGATPVEKTSAEEQFLKVGTGAQLQPGRCGTKLDHQVNNAYEVLTDPQKRRVRTLYSIPLSL